MNKLMSITAALLLGAAPSLASAADWTLDAAHSSINWDVDHMVISETSGQFKTFDVKITNFDGGDASKAKVTVTVDTTSIDSDNEKRDEHLKGPDFFDTAKYPTATFESKSIKKVSDKKYEVTGDFTLHGVTKTITLPVEFRGTVKDPWGNTKAGFKASTTIDRTDYGLTWDKTLETGGLVVGHDVDLVFNIEVQQAAAEQPKK